MAATAFTAASSRFSAAVMGRPLSVRILLASCTLVPGRDEKTRLQWRVPAGSNLPAVKDGEGGQAGGGGDTAKKKKKDGR